MNEHRIATLCEWAKAHAAAVAAACVVTLSLGLYLIAQHTAHALGALPYALILLCPMMHFLMPGMHGGHGSHSAHSRSETETQPRGEKS